MRIFRHTTLTAALLLAACGGGDRPPAADAGTEAGAPESAPASSGADGSGPASATAGRPLRDPVQLTVTAEVDGARSTYRGLGECHHTTEASIYDVPASMWSANADAGSGDLRYVNLTLWQPKATGEMQVSLGLTAHGVTHEIATVKGADFKGTGTGRVEPIGAGGAMHVEGKDAEGRGVRLTVECGRWTEPVAEGG
jgi:hypothetical protein